MYKSLHFVAVSLIGIAITTTAFAQSHQTPTPSGQGIETAPISSGDQGSGRVVTTTPVVRGPISSGDLGSGRIVAPVPRRCDVRLQPCSG